MYKKHLQFARMVCLAVTLAFASCSSLVGSAEPLIPATPAGKTLQAYLNALNSGDRSQITTYIDTYDPAQSVDGLLSFRAQTGGFNLLSIDYEDAGAITFRVKGKDDNLEATGTLLLASQVPPKVDSLTIRVLPPGAIIENTKLDSSERERVIAGVTSILKEHYVYPKLADEMASALDAHKAKGDYDSVTDGNIFAARLMKDLRAVSRDKHLFVDYSPSKLPVGQIDPGARLRMQREMERMNCGFEKQEILPHNIGYLKFNMFGNPEVCGPTLVSAMNFMAHVDAVIFDLRANGGGDPRMVTLAASYLFDQSTHLSDIYNRKENTTTQFWTLPYVPGGRLTGKPAFVLTSKDTFSGAEDFTYNLQALKRVTVVGETTGGGAHPVAGHRIDDHFRIGVPFARSINLITNTNWEGTGVKPDIPTTNNDALPTAVGLAEKKILESAAGSK